mmetsp:Transcript_99376/g.315446  ORF Transcript_99376/g.315446 Transcript_99376/m.315446 type:complete len:226 (-) Transcript_99376:514-1191(-)
MVAKTAKSFRGPSNVDTSLASTILVLCTESVRAMAFVVPKTLVSSNSRCSMKSSARREGVQSLRRGIVEKLWSSSASTSNTSSWPSASSPVSESSAPGGSESLGSTTSTCTVSMAPSPLGRRAAWMRTSELDSKRNCSRASAATPAAFIPMAVISTALSLESPNTSLALRAFARFSGSVCADTMRRLSALFRSGAFMTRKRWHLSRRRGMGWAETGKFLEILARA